MKAGDVEPLARADNEFTDGSLIGIYQGACGNNTSKGEIKFFFESTTGDLSGEDEISMEPGWDYYKSYGQGHAEQCLTSPFDLPSTGDEPKWWNNAPGDGPASRFASVYYSCCCGKEAISARSSP